jgi:hypothetical protein
VNEWANQDEDDENDDSGVGQKAINRMCQSMHQSENFDKVLAILEPALGQLINQQDWKSQVAALVILMVIAEYIDEDTMVAQMVGVVKTHLKSPHVRVRYQAWFTLLQFAQDRPKALEGSAMVAELMPDFLGGLGDNCPRVVIACMGAFQHYGQTVEEEDFEPFLQPLMQTLGGKLQGQGNARMMRETITCIATVAGQIGESLSQYYSALMPMLKQIVEATVHKEDERLLLGKTFECISLLATSVGHAAFLPDAEVIISAMIKATQAPNLAKDDPVYEYIMAAADRFCFVLKEDFARFLPHLLPLILEKLKFQPKEFSGDARDVKGDDDVNVSIVNKDGKAIVLVMSTSQMEDLQNALQCVFAFASRLGVSYAQFISQTAQALLPVFDFLMSEQIRDLAFDTWGHLCKDARDAKQPQVLNQLCQELMTRIVPRLADADSPVGALKTRCAGLASCLSHAGPNILDAQQVQHIGQLGVKLLSDSIGRRLKWEQKKNAKKAASQDGDEARDVEDEQEEEEELRSASITLSGSLMEHHPDHFMAQCFGAYVPVLQQLIQPTANDGDRQLAAQLAGSILEHLGERAAAQWQSFMPQLLEDMQAKHDDVRAQACYAMSQAARLSSFGPQAATAAQRAAQVVTQTRALSKKKSQKDAQCAADNALSVLLEVLEHHTNVVPGDLWATYLAGLPCQEDVVEGQRNNKALLRLAQQQAPGLCGEGGCNIPRVLELLVSAYNTSMADEETEKGFGSLLLALGEAKLQQFSANFTPKLKKKMLRVAKQAQKT